MPACEPEEEKNHQPRQIAKLSLKWCIVLTTSFYFLLGQKKTGTEQCPPAGHITPPTNSSHPQHHNLPMSIRNQTLGAAMLHLEGNRGSRDPCCRWSHFHRTVHSHLSATSEFLAPPPEIFFLDLRHHHSRSTHHPPKPPRSSSWTFVIAIACLLAAHRSHLRFAAIVAFSVGMPLAPPMLGNDDMAPIGGGVTTRIFAGWRRSF